MPSVFASLKQKIHKSPASGAGKGMPGKAAEFQLKINPAYAKDQEIERKRLEVLEKSRLEKDAQLTKAAAAKEKELIEQAQKEEETLRDRKAAASVTNETSDLVGIGVATVAGGGLAAAKGLTFDQNMLRADYQAPTGTVGSIGGASVGAVISGASLVMNGIAVASNAGDWSHADAAKRRNAQGEIKAGLRGAAINTVATAQGAVAISVAAGAVAGAAVVAAPVLGVVAGGATMVRAGVRGVQASRYEKRLRAIDQEGLGQLAESIDYSARQMNVRKKKMVVETVAATLGTAGAIAMGTAAVAGTAVLMATPVGWALAAGAAALGLGYLGYKIYRKLRKKGTSGVLREEHAGRIINAFVNGDAAAQKAGGDVLSALGISADRPTTPEGIKHLTDLLAKKLKSS